VKVESAESIKLRRDLRSAQYNSAIPKVKKALSDINEELDKLAQDYKIADKTTMTPEQFYRALAKFKDKLPMYEKFFKFSEQVNLEDGEFKAVYSFLTDEMENASDKLAATNAGSVNMTKNTKK
jgi:uncharacterized coiled-coil DUF342 family protein